MWDMLGGSFGVGGPVGLLSLLGVDGRTCILVEGVILSLRN